MLISISGPSSSGKSTLILELFSYLKENPRYINNLPVIIDTFQFARSLLKIKPKFSWNDLVKVKEFQEELLINKICYERMYIDSPQCFVVERSYLDLYVYYKLHYESITQRYNLQNSELPDFLLTYKDRCIHEQKKQLGLFYLKNCPLLETDGTRIVSSEYVEDQKQEFLNLFEELDLKGFYCCYETTLKNRLDDFLIHLYNLHKTTISFKK